jgi:hypothetical protein
MERSGPGKLNDDQFVMADAHLDGLALLVGTVIDRVDHGFLDGSIGEVPDPRGLGAVTGA